MIRWFAFGQHATGVIAIGQEAVGVIAIGQLATGVVAVGQLARGVVVVGQLAVGVVAIGQLGIGVAWAAGMVGIGGRAGFGWILPLFPRRPATATATLPGGGTATVPTAAAGTVVRPWAVVGLAVVAVGWWLVAGAPVWEALGGVLNPPPVLR